MPIRKAIIMFFSFLVMAFVVTAGIVLYRHTTNLREIVDIHTYVSIAIAMIGGLASMGASTGGDAWSHYASQSVSHDPEEYRRLEGQDVGRGIAFGYVVFTAGLVSAALGYLIWKLVG